MIPNREHRPGKAALEQLFTGSQAIKNNHDHEISVRIKPDRLKHLRTENLNFLISKLGSSKSISKHLGLPLDHLDNLRSGKTHFTAEIANQIESRLGLPVGWFSGIAEPMIPSLVLNRFRFSTTETQHMKTDTDVVVEKLRLIQGVFPGMRKYLSDSTINQSVLSLVMSGKRAPTSAFVKKVEDALKVRHGWMYEQNETAESIRTTLVSTLGLDILDRPLGRGGRRAQDNNAAPAPAPAAPAQDPSLAGSLIQLLQARINAGALSNLQIGRLLVALESN